MGIFLGGLKTLVGTLLATAVTSATSAVPNGLTLRAALELARAGPAARAALEQVNVAQGQLTQAGLAPNPKLYLSSEDLQPWESRFSYAKNTEDYAYVGQVLEVAGKRHQRSEVARARMLGAEGQRQRALQELSAEVGARYWSVVAAGRGTQLLQQDLSAVEAMVRYHEERLASGAVKGVDLLRMQIERDRVRIALALAERDRDTARMELASLLGLPPQASLQPTDALERLDAPTLPSPEAALAKRPDVTAAREALAAASSDTRLQHALAIPDPDLLAGYKRNSGANTLYLGLQISLPLWDRNQGEVQRAQAQERLARAELERTELAARTQMAAALRAFQTQEELLRTLMPDLQARAQKDLSIMNEAYRTGGMDLLRYIDAVRTELEVERTSLQALVDYHQSALRLQLAYGEMP